MRSWTVWVGAAAMALAACLGGGCVHNAATGSRIFTLLSPEEEARIGAEAAPGFTEEFGGEMKDAALQAYVDGIGKKMAAQTEAYFPGLDWEFTLLDSDVVNAFALPGGKVFFSRGLAERLTSEAQMAGVLGHEIGHVTAQHGAQRISQAGLINAVVAGAAVGVAVAGDETAAGRYGQVLIPAMAIGGQVVLLKYGRDQELQADALGMRYMSKVGYDPAGQLQVMQVLKSLSEGGQRPPEILSSHPEPDRRIDQIHQLLATTYASTQNNPQYQAFEQRYRDQFLARLPKRTGEAPLDPATYCLHCAHEEGESRVARAPR